MGAGASGSAEAGGAGNAEPEPAPEQVPSQAPPPPPGGDDCDPAKLTSADSIALHAASSASHAEHALHGGGTEPEPEPELSLEPDDESNTTGKGDFHLLSPPKSPSPTPGRAGTPGGPAEDEIELWRGALETVKSAKNGDFKGTGLNRTYSIDIKWQKRFAVVWGSESFSSWNPRIEIYKDYKAAAKALSNRDKPDSPKKRRGLELSYSLGEASVTQETEDKFNTMLLAFKQRGQSEEDAMRLRLIDKSEENSAKTFQNALANAMATPPETEPGDFAGMGNDSQLQLTESVAGTPRSQISTSDFGSSEWELVIENDAASRIQAAYRGKLQRRRIAHTELGMQLKGGSLFAIGALADRETGELNETRNSTINGTTLPEKNRERSTLNRTDLLMFDDGEKVTVDKDKEQNAMRAIDRAKQDEISRLQGEVEEWDISIEINKNREQDAEIKRLREQVAKREADFAALLEDTERKNELRIQAEKQAEAVRISKAQEVEAAVKTQEIERAERTRKALEDEKAAKERREKESGEIEAQIRATELEVEVLAKARADAEAVAKAHALQQAELKVAQAKAAEGARLLEEQEALERAALMAEVEAEARKREAEAAKIRREKQRNAASTDIQRVERGRQARSQLTREQQQNLDRRRLWQMPLRERRKQWEIRLANEKEAAEAKKRKYQEHHAAARVQARVRGNATREVVRPMITKVREEALEHARREHERLVREAAAREEASAAARIQAIQRGKLERRRVDEMKKQRQADIDLEERKEQKRIEAEERAEQAKAATKIAVIQRGKQTRRTQLAAKEARAERMAHENEKKGKENQSAAKIQAIQRGKLGRRKANEDRNGKKKHDRDDLEENAATKIQAIQRGKLGRRLSPPLHINPLHINPRIAARTKEMERLGEELYGQWVLIEGDKLYAQVMNMHYCTDSATPEVRIRDENGKEGWRSLSKVAKVYGSHKPGARSIAGAMHLVIETEKIVRRISPQRERALGGLEPGKGMVPVGSIFHLLPDTDQNMQSRINSRVQNLGPGMDRDDRYDGAPDGYEWETESENMPDTPRTDSRGERRGGSRSPIEGGGSYGGGSGSAGGSPPRVHHGGGAYHLSAQAKTQREHAAVLRQIQQAMQQQAKRKLNGHSIVDSRGVFHAMDRDNSGTLDPGEFADAMRRLGLGLTAQQVGGLARALDRDGDGAIDYEELLDYLHGKIPVVGPDGYDEDAFVNQEQEQEQETDGESRRVRSVSPPQRSRSPQIPVGAKGRNGVYFGGGGGGGGGGTSPNRGRPPGMGGGSGGGGGGGPPGAGGGGPNKIVRDSGDKPWGDNKVSNQIPPWMLERKKQAEAEAKAKAQEEAAQGTQGQAAVAVQRAVEGDGEGEERGRQVSPPIPTHRQGGSRFPEGQSPGVSFEESDDEALSLAGGLNGLNRAGPPDPTQQQRAKPRGPIGHSMDAALLSAGEEEENLNDNESLAGSEYSQRTDRSSAYSSSVSHSGISADERVWKQAHARRVLKGVCKFGNDMLSAKVTERLGPEAAAKVLSGKASRPAAPPVDEDWVELGRTECIQDDLNPKFATSLTVSRLGKHARKNLAVRWLRVVVLDVDGDGIDLKKDDLCGEATLDIDDWLGELSRDAEARAKDSADFADLALATKEVTLRRPKDKKQKAYGTVRLIIEPLRRGMANIHGRASGAVRVSMRASQLVNVEGFMSKSDPFCCWSRALPPEYEGGPSPRWAVCHRTEWLKSTLDPLWAPFDIPLSALCGGDRDTSRGLLLQVFDYEKSGSHRLLGELTTTCAELLALRSEVDQSGGSAAELVLAWPKDGPLAEKVAKAKKKGKATEEAGSLLFDVFSLMPGTANDPGVQVMTAAATANDEDQFLVSIEADNLPNMDIMSKSDPIALLSVQETLPTPKSADSTLIGKMGLSAARRNVSVARILRQTPDFRAANRA